MRKMIKMSQKETIFKKDEIKQKQNIDIQDQNNLEDSDSESEDE